MINTLQAKNSRHFEIRSLYVCRAVPQSCVGCQNQTYVSYLFWASCGAGTDSRAPENRLGSNIPIYSLNHFHKMCPCVTLLTRVINEHIGHVTLATLVTRANYETGRQDRQWSWSTRNLTLRRSLFNHEARGLLVRVRQRRL